MSRARPLLRALALGGVAALVACGAPIPPEAPPPLPSQPPAAQTLPAPASPAADGMPPTARRRLVRELRDDLARKRSLADGGGRAWFEPKRPRVTAESAHRLRMVYEAGERGIAPGGSILLETKKWWYWSPAQSRDPDAPGYVTAATRAAGVELELRDVPATGTSIEVGGVAIEIDGRSLRAGERVEIVFGAGPSLAQVDAFAERGERLWLQVDGDGDGVRGLVEDSPTLDVEAAAPTQLWAVLPSTARVGDTIPLRIAQLDRRANWSRVPGRVALAASEGLDVPAEVALRDGRAEVPVRVASSGVLRVHVSGLQGSSARSNPVVVLPQTRRVLWADLHGHSHFSDGTGLPEDYFRFARDVAGLDVAVLTDHDHVGRRTLDEAPDRWREIRGQVEAFHAPGRFVTILGYEWTSWIHGHRHVLYFGEDGAIYSAADPAHESPVQLWAALRGKQALTFAHHSAGGPIATNWAIAPDPELEPVTEITSVHGSSEAPDSEPRIHQPVRGNFVRDVLARGARLGFVGSGDSHDGHPGLAHVGNPGGGGLAAILSEDATREGVLEALRARRVYATSGPRIHLDVTLDGAPMGSVVPAKSARLSALVVGEDAVGRVDLIRSGVVVRSVPGEGRGRIGFVEPIADLRAGETLYVRAVQEDGGTAWSSPFFVERPPR
ncbi:MAG: hypothetical protein DCC71_20535 [Proteobacteria bacterium]|nr:MAG: hypothetical protein DCC71_20535 [Pseudomonadota bacterium]